LPSFVPARAPAPKPRASAPEAGRLLEMAFGKEEPILRDATIRFVIRVRGPKKREERLAFATQEVGFREDGELTLKPIALAWYSQDSGKLIPARCMRSPSVAELAFDRPVRRLADLGAARLVRIRTGSDTRIGCRR